MPARRTKCCKHTHVAAGQGRWYGLQYLYTVFKALRLPIKTIHIKETGHKCHICVKCYAERTWILEPTEQESHLTLEGHVTICDNCGNNFAHKRRWHGHIKCCGIPKDQCEPLKCKYCPKDFPTSKDRKAHVKISHKETLKYSYMHV